MSLTVGFFMDFRVGSSDGKIRSDKVIISNNVRWYVVDLES